jgi:hypothetical protein
MLKANRLAAVTVAATLAFAAPALGGAFGPPKDGLYGGKRVTLSVSGTSIELAAIQFPCGEVTGRTNLNDIPLKKTSKGYAFFIRAHGNITYSDEQADENGLIQLSGRFARYGRSVVGHVRVDSRRCEDTGTLKWRSKRA